MRRRRNFLLRYNLLRTPYRGLRGRGAPRPRPPRLGAPPSRPTWSGCAVPLLGGGRSGADPGGVRATGAASNFSQKLTVPHFVKVGGGASPNPNARLHRTPPQNFVDFHEILRGVRWSLAWGLGIAPPANFRKILKRKFLRKIAKWGPPRGAPPMPGCVAPPK